MHPVRALAARTVVGLAAATGCLPGQPAGPAAADNTPRAQVADDAAVATVGQKTVVGNTEPVVVSGVGLVTELRGTGSSPPPDALRAQLEGAVRKRKGNPKELLDDPSRSTSLVLVSASIPAGARPGDRLDVAVTVPTGSRTASLKGGVLFATELSNHEFVGALRQQLGLAPGASSMKDDAILRGHQLADAEGPLLAGRLGAKKDGDEADPGANTAGMIWGGGRNKLARPYYLLLEDANPQPRLALVVAERLNSTFHVPGDTAQLAEAKVQGSKPLVTTLVPPMYRLNHGRYLLVARHVPLSPLPPDSPYRKKLEADLLRPELAIVAAVKLEALGADSKQPLRVGLQSDNPWVRFAAAESLAYLGHADGARVLAEAAEQHPALRTHALLALASLDDGPCVDRLVDLLRHPDPSLRYGAFVALRSADPTHEAVKGVKAAGGYTLHQVPADGPPLVHVSADRRCEVVLFGKVWPLKGPLSLSLGSEYTVTVKEADGGGAVVTRVARKDGEPVSLERPCRADAGAVLAELAKLGAGFPEAVEFLKRADAAQAVACAVEFDAAPRGLSVQQLVTIARSDPSIERADLEAKRVGQVVPAGGFDLPGAGESLQATPPPPAAPNRDPGRLLGGPDAGPSLSKDPGRLFGKR